MKKIHLSILLMVVGFASYGQFDNTKFVLDGTAGFDFNDSFGNTRSTSFSISPALAKPVKSNALLGIEAGFSFYRSEYEGDGFSSTYKSTAVVPAIYYQQFYSLTDKLFFNWKAKAGAGFSKQVTTDGTTDDTTNITTLSVGLRPGLSWRVMDKVLLNASVGNIAFTHQRQEGANTTSFGLSFNHPAFGFSFLLQ